MCIILVWAFHTMMIRSHQVNVQSDWDQSCWELVLELLNEGALYFITDRTNVPEEYTAVVAAEGGLDEDEDSETENGG